jgi:ATP-dependent RNA helicase DDX49/DBP8
MYITRTNKNTRAYTHSLTSIHTHTHRKVGIARPTKIQRHCIPLILAGRNVIGAAETGSGKTAAFALPILQALSADPYGIFALILTPTRELAIQVSVQLSLAWRAVCGVRSRVLKSGELDV